MTTSNPFGDLFGMASGSGSSAFEQMFGKHDTMAENFSKIAENSKVKLLEEENAKLKAEIERLHEIIIRCPKCGTKLRLPKQ